MKSNNKKNELITKLNNEVFMLSEQITKINKENNNNMFEIGEAMQLIIDKMKYDNIIMMQLNKQVEYNRKMITMLSLIIGAAICYILGMIWHLQDEKMAQKLLT